MCKQPGSTGAELLKKWTWYALLIWKWAFLPAETVDDIDHCTSSTTAQCLHVTPGIALIQHPNVACYISRRTCMGTSKHSNPSTTGSATPTRYDNYNTVALGYQHAKEHAVWQQFLSKVYLRAACSLIMVNAGLFTFDMPRAFFGFTGGLRDWNLAFIPQW